MHRLANKLVWYLAVLALGMPSFASALVTDENVLRSTVVIFCEGRKGSGAVTDGVAGYVVTSGHVARDTETGAEAGSCTVGIPDAPGGQVSTFFRAEVVHSVFDRVKDLDFAVLRVGQQLSGPVIGLPAGIPAYEFALKGDPVTVLGYPGDAEAVVQRDGEVLDFSRGYLLTDAVFSEGNSGGPTLAADGALLGLAARLRFQVSEETGEPETIDFGVGDVLALITWLDVIEPDGGHSKFLRHADPARYFGSRFVSRDEDNGCNYVVRTASASAVYCLYAGRSRAVFPDQGTFLSWYPDFSDIIVTDDETLARYSLRGIVTHKAGTLLKIQTDPKVYVVTDSIGTLRWVPTEALAAELFGADWASRVRDVPDTLFASYSFAPPLE